MTALSAAFAGRCDLQRCAGEVDWGGDAEVRLVGAARHAGVASRGRERCPDDPGRD